MQSGPYGGIGGDFNANARRADEGKVIKYVPLKEIDEAVKAGNQPALTVVPVRLVTIHASVPYKKQVEEIKRALRLDTDATARQWGPVVRRVRDPAPREPGCGPDGKGEVLQEWAGSAARGPRTAPRGTTRSRRGSSRTSTPGPSATSTTRGSCRTSSARDDAGDAAAAPGEDLNVKYPESAEVDPGEHQEVGGRAQAEGVGVGVREAGDRVEDAERAVQRGG
jgi:hypothetical protein